MLVLQPVSHLLLGPEEALNVLLGDDNVLWLAAVVGGSCAHLLHRRFVNLVMDVSHVNMHIQAKDTCGKNCTEALQ